MFVFYGYCLHAQDFMRNIISKFRKYVDQLKEPNKSLDDYLHSSLSQAFNHGHLSTHQDLLPGGDDDDSDADEVAPLLADDDGVGLPVIMHGHIHAEPAQLVSALIERPIRNRQWHSQRLPCGACSSQAMPWERTNNPRMTCGAPCHRKDE